MFIFAEHTGLDLFYHYNLSVNETVQNKLGNYCGYCFLYDDNEKERIENKSSVVKSLEYFAGFFDEDNNYKRDIIKKALEICDKCDYQNPNVFHFLEKSGFKFS